MPVISTQYCPVSVLAEDSTKVIIAGQENREMWLMAMIITTGATSADLVIQDTDGNNIGGKILLGTGTGGGRHDDHDLPFNPAAWCKSPVGKGIQVSNVDAAAVEILAVIYVVDT